MNKNVKISLWVGGIALVSYLLYKHSKKTSTTTPATTKTTATTGEQSSNASGQAACKPPRHWDGLGCSVTAQSYHHNRPAHN